MSRIRIVKGKITENIGENLSFFSQKNIVESSNSFYSENSEIGINYGSNPENAPASNIANFYVKIRLNTSIEDHKGIFGFDWIDINSNDGTIEKIQNVNINNVEYFYKEGRTREELGDIIKVDDSNKNTLQQVIKKNYEPILHLCTNGYIDIPFVLIKPNQEISLKLEVNICNELLPENKVIFLEDDEFYSFEFDKGSKNGKKSEKTFEQDKEEIVLKIKCLKEAPETKYKIKTEGNIPVGGFVMMENKILKLKFRVIALVSSDDGANERAKNLFKQFKNADIKDYLNNHSLNQAGYEVEIENQAMFDAIDTADLDDYFYAFNKEEWTQKEYFKIVDKEKYDTIPDTDDCKPGSWDHNKNDCKKIFVPTETITSNFNIDNIVFEEYQKKLKTKDKSYNGGIIILCDYESPTDTGAFSRIEPLDYYKLFIYSTNLKSKDTYAHEIGHMLGLPHTFFDEEEKEAYKIARENIIGNGEPENNIDGSSNEKYKEGILTKISKVNRETFGYYTMLYAYERKDNIILYLKKFNEFYQSGIDRNMYNNITISNLNNCINKNNIAIGQLNSDTECRYKQYFLDGCFLREDYITYLKNEETYFREFLQQIEQNILFYKLKSTNNVMDYNYGIKLLFTHNQIKIMRSDIKNVIEC